MLYHGKTYSVGTENDKYGSAAAREEKDGRQLLPPRGRDSKFVLLEHLDIKRLLSYPPYQEFSAEASP